jgi:hypothetical protein
MTCVTHSEGLRSRLLRGRKSWRRTCEEVEENQNEKYGTHDQNHILWIVKQF